MTTEVLIPLLTPQFFANNGQFLTGGLLYSYAAGTSTPAPTYTDSGGLTPNANPIVLNSRGECSVWYPPNTSMKFTLTDSVGNLIWTRDQVVQSQLITYYGVDTGAANAYILTALTPYTSYQDGELVFFLPANTNTGPSTVNINGLGAIPIVTITGAALGAGQIQAGIMAEMIYVNGNFQLISIGSFTGPTVGTFGQEVPIASATTTDLGTLPAHTGQVTGSTTITSFGSSASITAPYYLLRFSGVMQLTYNATSMALPGNTNIITASGDSAIAQYLGNGNWRIAFYQYATGSGINAKIKPSDTQRLSTTTLTNDPDLISNLLGVGRYSWEVMLIFDSVAAGAGFKWSNVTSGSAVDSRAAAPGVADGFVNAGAYGPKNETPYGTTISYATVGTGTNSNIVLYKGSLLVSTAGTFGVSWAQVSSTASNTILRAGSYLTVTLLNTGSTSGTVTRIYTTPGPAVETIPTGFTTCLIEVWAGGGGGGVSFGSTGAMTLTGGGGGGSGGYSRTSITVTGHGGDTLNYSVGSGGAVGFTGVGSSVSSGTFSLTTLTTNPGVFGTSATSTIAPGTGGAGGTATGGTIVNTNGNAGSAGLTFAGGGLGGAPGLGIPGINDGGNSGGRGGGITAAGAGGGAIVCFSYS